MEPARGGRHSKHAKVEYLVKGEKSGHRVRARHVVMASWNRVTAHIVEGLPRQQVRDLC